MFNLQGSELVIILLLALVVLGPEKLPDAMRKAGQLLAEVKKMSSGFQSEFKAAVEEPLSELKDTANTLRDSADFTKLQAGERPEKPKSAEMVAAPDPTAVPTDELPFTPAAAATGAIVESDMMSDAPQEAIVESDLPAGTAENTIVESDLPAGTAENTIVESDIVPQVPPPAAPIPAPPKPFSSSQQLSTSLPAQPEQADTPPGAPGPAPAVGNADAAAPEPDDCDAAGDEVGERPE